MKKLVVLVLAMCVAASVMAQDKKAVPSLDKDGKMVIAAKDMTLTDCEIVADTAASSKSAVKLLKVTSAGTIDVKLPKGDYILNLVLNGPDGDHDALVIQANGQKTRTYSPNQTWGKYLTGFKNLAFQVGDDGKATVSFTAAEFNMLLDKFEITKK